MTIRVQADVMTNPDVKVGGYLTLERADGRSVWRQRLKVVGKGPGWYRLEPVDELEGYAP